MYVEVAFLKSSHISSWIVTAYLSLPKYYYFKENFWQILKFYILENISPYHGICYCSNCIAEK